MKKFIVMMLMLATAFSLSAYNNGALNQENEGSIDVPSTVGAVPEDIYEEVSKLEKSVYEAVRYADISNLEEYFIYRLYDADDVMIATATEGARLEVYLITKDGVHVKAGDQVSLSSGGYLFYSDSGILLSEEATAELIELKNSCARIEPVFSRSFTCISTIDKVDVTFANDAIMVGEYCVGSDETSEEVVTVRHAVALSGYDGLSSYVLYRHITGPEDDRVVIEVDGTAYSLAKGEDYLGLYDLLYRLMT